MSNITETSFIVIMKFDETDFFILSAKSADDATVAGETVKTYLEFEIPSNILHE